MQPAFFKGQLNTTSYTNMTIEEYLRIELTTISNINKKCLTATYINIFEKGFYDGNS